ncbi:MAG: zinc ribbon domain-containing protein [Erysipelotrichaceae bacterium]|nr:zinc ribbon domain-containing protein [Erysipelotrichaceae bacterium]
MVNCKNCGAPLTLKDAVCPHCGTPNPEAQEHLKKLKKLEKEYASAQNEVKEEVKQVRSGYSLLVILAILLLANLILVPLHSASYEIAERIIAKRMPDNEITARMDELLEEGEFIEFKVFTDKFILSYSKYGEYLTVASLADDYNRILENTNNYFYGTNNYSDPLVRLCENIGDFKESYQYAQRREMSQKMTDYVEKINGEVDRVLRVYLHFTDADIESIPDLSSSALLILMNERLGYEK